MEEHSNMLSSPPIAAILVSLAARFHFSKPQLVEGMLIFVL